MADSPGVASLCALLSAPPAARFHWAFHAVDAELRALLWDGVLDEYAGEGLDAADLERATRRR